MRPPTLKHHAVSRTTRRPGRIAVILQAGLLTGAIGACHSVTELRDEPDPPDLPEPPDLSLPDDLSGRIAFVRGRHAHAEIFAIDPDGTDLERLTISPGADQAPAWSPDGSRIAFVSERGGDGEMGLFTMAADGSDVRVHATGLPSWGNYVGWSPDGSTIAYSDGGIALAGVDPQRANATLLDYPGPDIQPAWSPDGRRIAFVTDYRGYDFLLDIFTMNADGSSPRLLAERFPRTHVFYYLHPTWSPDGSMIAFVYGAQGPVSVGSATVGQDMRFTLAIMTADGEFIGDLAWVGDISSEEHELYPGSLAWSPDGRGIAYTFVDCDLWYWTRCPGVRSIRYVSLDGEYGGTIVDHARDPSWRP